MKKLLTGVASAALVFSMVVPAFAYGRHHSSNSNTNTAFVSNSTTATANTGYNVQGNYAGANRALVSGEVEAEGNNDMTTGDARAKANGVVVANTQVGDDCGCRGRNTNTAFVRNETGAGANTGENLQGNTANVEWAIVGGRRHGGEVEAEGNNTLRTGEAKAKANGFVVVNTQVSL